LNFQVLGGKRKKFTWCAIRKRTGKMATGIGEYERRGISGGPSG